MGKQKDEYYSLLRKLKIALVKIKKCEPEFARNANRKLRQKYIAAKTNLTYEEWMETPEGMAALIANNKENNVTLIK